MGKLFKAIALSLHGLKEEISIFWFRRDLRLHDNCGLYHALKAKEKVLPIFIFDRKILDRLENKQDRRVDFIHQALEQMQVILMNHGSGLRIFQCSPLEAFQELFREYRVKCIYLNNDYEPYAGQRDEEIRTYAAQMKADFHSFKDQVIFEKDEVVKDDGKPYTVFTPYSRKWKLKLNEKGFKKWESEKYFGNFLPYKAQNIPTLKEIGFSKTDMVLDPKMTVRTDLLKHYKDQRDIPGIEGTSRLSIYLRFGVVSIRDMATLGMKHSETWLNELIWREFYMMILWHFPHAAQRSFKKEYDAVEWRNNEKEFKLWCEGRTGFPIVDAGMRELNTTGFMHNRVRMIVSSFLVKDLLIDWRWGEAYFAEKLNDFDLSANNGGWQWAAGSGCDAAPYFRIFNPTEQQKKFDPEFKYIKKWVPEYCTSKYPAPMVDHAMARKRTLEVYKNALSGAKQGKLF